MEKSEILAKFSSEPERYYTVRLFKEKGFERRCCSVCGRYFWSADSTKNTCPEDSDDAFSFIGNPPTARRFDYAESWRHIESYFVRHNHTSIGRYPVVCRWRDDLHFTIASIVDFQRVLDSKVSFQFPANPLVVPQTCLRFKDLENVGVTGRHFSSFCMIGQHSMPDAGGYWKNECIDLDYGLLTEEFGIPESEITFVEDVWEGGGSFGSSLEYFVRGLELGNAVFTEFQGTLENHTILDKRVIDMGAGLERFAWITMGTPTAYDCCFGPVMDILMDAAGVGRSQNLAAYYARIAAGLAPAGADAATISKEAAAAAGLADSPDMISSAQGAYLIADHIRTLIFAISDGALPSNVGGGYNLRMMLRRVIATAEQRGIPLDIDNIVDAHIDYLKGTYPELDSGRDDVKEILGIEACRYAESKSRMSGIAAKIHASGRELDVGGLITLYESDGITPEYLLEAGAITSIPPSFYTRVSELHKTSKKNNVPPDIPDGIPETIPLYYRDDPSEFEAKVLWADKDRIVLDRTSFYPRGGGQEPDRGKVGDADVLDVSKYSGIILHRIDGRVPRVGDTVSCTVDTVRRGAITRHHTGTHILNASARSILGSWVWQHSAFKDEDHARLDITHHSALTDSQVKSIEDAANSMIRENHDVMIEKMGRGEAEQRYGFRIYQGGVVPVKSVRIVSIGERDVEACGGTHVSRTGEVESIRITRTKRIQDGVVRLEFVAGNAAHRYKVQEAAESERMKEEEEKKRKRDEERASARMESRKIIPDIISEISVLGAGNHEYAGMQVVIHDNMLNILDGTDSRGELFHTRFGEDLLKRNSRAVYCAVFRGDRIVRIIAYCGPESGMDARDIVSRVSVPVGGSGGGTARFAQGGGKNMQGMADALEYAGREVLGREA